MGCFDLLGTPEYMGISFCCEMCKLIIAPELIALRDTNGGYGQAVDVWALGVVLYILYFSFRSPGSL